MRGKIVKVKKKKKKRAQRGSSSIATRFRPSKVGSVSIRTHVTTTVPRFPWCPLGVYCSSCDV